MVSKLVTRDHIRYFTSFYTRWAQYILERAKVGCMLTNLGTFISLTKSQFQAIKDVCYRWKMTGYSLLDVINTD